MSALLQRKTMSAPLYPQIGHVFANLPPNSGAAPGASETVKEEEGGGGGAKDSLLINVIEEGNKMLENLRILNLKPQACTAFPSLSPNPHGANNASPFSGVPP